MRYVRPRAEAVAEVTAVLEPPPPRLSSASYFAAGDTLGTLGLTGPAEKTSPGCANDPRAGRGPDPALGTYPAGRKGCTFDRRMSGSVQERGPGAECQCPVLWSGQPCFPVPGRRCCDDSRQARRRACRLEQDLLVAEAEQAALGWMYLTVEGIDIESEPGLERYLRALDAFGEVAAGRQGRYCSTSSRLTFGIRGEAAGQATRGEDASDRIAV